MPVAVAQVRDAGLQFAAFRHLPVNDGLALGAVTDVAGRGLAGIQFRDLTALAAEAVPQPQNALAEGGGWRGRGLAALALAVAGAQPVTLGPVSVRPARPGGGFRGGACPSGRRCASQRRPSWRPVTRFAPGQCHMIEAPAGLKDRARADPLNYDRPTWQQAKRLGEDPRDLKRIIQDAWAVSDNRASFESALAPLRAAPGPRRPPRLRRRPS